MMTPGPWIFSRGSCYRRIRPRTVLPLVLSLCMAACSGPDTPPPANFQELAEASLISVEGSRTIPGLHADVEILRDPWGIAHIYAENREDLFLAQGYVQAQDRLWQMDMWRRVNEGRLAEILGPEAFEHDRLARLLLFRGSWEEEWAVYHPEGEMIFRRFAEGVNALIDELGEDLPVEYRLTGLTPLPWTPQASTGRVATALPLAAARAELNLARRVAELGVDQVNRQERPRHANWIDLAVPDGMDPSLIQTEAVEALSHFRGDMPRPPVLPMYEAWAEAEASENLGAQENAPGSNNWVVSPRLTATGQVLLANDPHRGVTNPSLRYLIHLNAPGYSVIGSTEPAIPGVAIGHNGKVAWGLTIVGTDQADVFLERMNPENPEEVWEDGGWVPLRSVVDTIPVRGEAPRIVIHRFSRNGPIFFVDEVHHLAYAVRSTSTEPGTGGYLGALRLADAEDCHDFLDSVAYYFAPSENMICGDADGNIAWLAAALTPNRVGGWLGRLPVPGWGAFGWDGFRSHTELPQEFNPERGWIGTANHDIQPPGYFPPLMFRPGPFSRWDRLQAMFEGASALTRDDMKSMILDANHPWFPRDRPLFTGWTAADGDVEWARAALEGWDGVFHRDRVEPALYNAWEGHMPAIPRTLPGDLPSDRDTTESALAQALETLTERFGEDRREWRWGRIHRSEFPHLLVRAYDLPTVGRHGGGGTTAATGATFRQIIDFSDLDGSLATSTPGQSMQPGSRFYGNLLPMWSEGEFFPLLFSRAAVEAEAEAALRLLPGG